MTCFAREQKMIRPQIIVLCVYHSCLKIPENIFFILNNRVCSYYKQQPHD